VNEVTQGEATMTDNDPTGSAPDEDPGYLIQTGDAVGDDGSVVPIIGGLPAVEGSSWDIGAPGDERGADLAEHLGHPLGDDSQEEDAGPRPD
jgi:hypothetical protein